MTVSDVSENIDILCSTSCVDQPEGVCESVHIEIRAALERDIPVIPVLVERTNTPRDKDLPEPLRPLAFRNAISVRPDPDFHNDMERLCRALSGVLKRAPKLAQPRPWAAVLVVASLIVMLVLGAAALYFFCAPSKTSSNKRLTEKSSIGGDGII